MTDVILGISVLLLGMGFMAAVADCIGAAIRKASPKTADQIANRLIDNKKEVE